MNEGRDIPVPPLTMIYSAANDVPMMVFEANNIGYKWDKRFLNGFAYEVEKKVEPTMRIHTLISDWAPKFPGMARKALNSIEKMTSASNELPPIIDALDKAWEDEHHDRYHTEVYFTTSCTSNGKTTSCSQQMHTRQVYDYTDHYYNYNRQAGELASRLLKDFVRKHPDIRIDEKLLLVPETNAENEWAMRQSRPAVKHEDWKQDDYLKLANTWATGSNLAILSPVAYKDHLGLLERTPQWNSARLSARSESYRTYRHSDAGPQEFQIAEAALSYAVEMSDSINRISGGIKYAGDNVPLLSRKIQQYVNVALHGEKGDEKALKQEVMTMAGEIYKRNYAEGFDIDPFKVGHIILWGVLGALAGAGAGFGADRLISKSKKSDEYFEEKNRSRISRSYRTGG